MKRFDVVLFLTGFGGFCVGYHSALTALIGRLWPFARMESMSSVRATSAVSSGLCELVLVAVWRIKQRQLCCASSLQNSEYATLLRCVIMKGRDFYSILLLLFLSIGAANSSSHKTFSIASLHVATGQS